jgi:hypothetical protein
MYNLGSLLSKPTINVEIPKGRTPPLWVYFYLVKHVLVVILIYAIIILLLVGLEQYGA